MRRLMLAIAVTALLAAGCGEAASSRATSTSTRPSTQTAKAQPNAADVMFVQMMIPHHRQAVEMAELVPSRTTRPELRTLASDVVRSQTAEITTMTGWLTSWGKPLSSRNGMGGMAMDGGMTIDQMKSLQDLRDGAFDAAFVRLMQAHHEGAIQMATMELQNGSHQEVKRLAQQIVTAQEAEVAKMQQWQRQWPT